MANAVGDRFNWRLPLWAVSITIIVCVLAALAESDGLLYLLLVVPSVSLSLSAFCLIAAITKKPRLCLAILSMLAVYWILSFAFLKNYHAVRDATRWSLFSHRYKAEVLTQPGVADEEFKHIEWDGWGFAGAETNEYLAFDPMDSLAAAAKSRQPGKYHGIPCPVALVSRLEARWYAISFYTDESWGKSHQDCGMND